MTVPLSPLFTWRSQIASPDSGLSPNARHIALTLSLHMTERGDSCFPSYTTLAGETGRGRTTVSNGIQELENKGWLKIRRAQATLTGSGPGRAKPNRYEAQIPEIKGPDAGRFTDDKRSRGKTFSPEIKGPEGRPFSTVKGPETDIKRSRGGTGGRHRGRIPLTGENGSAKTNGKPPAKNTEDEITQNLIQSLVGYYVDECKEQGYEPLRNWRARIGKELKLLVTEKPEDLIRWALAVAAEEHKSPAALTGIVVDLEARRRNGFKTGSRPGR